MLTKATRDKRYVSARLLVEEATRQHERAQASALRKAARLDKLNEELHWLENMPVSDDGVEAGEDLPGDAAVDAERERRAARKVDA